MNENEIEKEELNGFSQEEIFSAIELLPPIYKIVFNLSVIEEYKHKEIGEMLGIDESSSRARLSRARQMLQMTLKKINTTNRKEVENYG